MSQAAARVFDLISHAAGGLAAAIAGGVGAVVGAVAGGALALGAPIGGALLMGPAMLAGAKRGLSMGQSALASIRALLGLSDPTTGLLWSGSAQVMIDGKAAVRAELDKAACHGRWMLAHFPKVAARVATGSATVLIDGKPAGRVGDLLECSAKIKTGSATVLFGGPPAPVLTIHGTHAQRLKRWVTEGLTLVAGVAANVAILGAMSLAVVHAPWALCLLKWGEVTHYSYPETRQEVLDDIEAKYGQESDELQADVAARIARAENSGEIADSIDNGFYGSPRHQQFGRWVSNMTEGEISPTQAMMMQPWGGDMGPGTGIYAAGQLGRHSLIHDVEGFLGSFGLGPGYGGIAPSNKFSGQLEGIIREWLFPTPLALH